jgi:dihydrofolate synthase/folylpolyglutamate synthase
MDYTETLNYLYTRMPLFQMVGSSGYKEGLDSMIALDNYLGNPHTGFPIIHVGGTNGKGSVSHTIASILQAAGYKTGLFTSPHLKDFRERIRINGIPVPENFVINFIEKYKDLFETLYPSFFEVNTAMAFQYFKEQQVDIAVIEVGLGGRLDSTNIVNPFLSIITNISFDHMDILGNTLPAIAREKAGIIKPGIPVVIGEAEGEVKEIFRKKASETGSPVFFSDIIPSEFIGTECTNGKTLHTFKIDGNIIRTPLLGDYQQTNMVTAWNASQVLESSGLNLPFSVIQKGFEQVIESTGLQGRWQILQEKPLVICDTGHNIAGITFITEQLKKQTYDTLRMVIGFVNDKDLDSILKILPKEAVYYFTNASIPRALPADILFQKAQPYGLQGDFYLSVSGALEKALLDASAGDLIFVGGSTFVVAEIL